MRKLSGQPITTIEMLNMLKYLTTIDKGDLVNYIDLLPSLQNSVIRKLIDEIKYGNSHKFNDEILQNMKLIKYFIKNDISIFTIQESEAEQPLFETLRQFTDEDALIRGIIVLQYLNKIGIKQVINCKPIIFQEMYDFVSVTEKFSRRIYTNGKFECHENYGWVNSDRYAIQNVRFLKSNWYIEIVKDKENFDNNLSNIYLYNLDDVIIKSLPKKEELERFEYSDEERPKIYSY